jgi:beta-galactosidase
VIGDFARTAFDYVGEASVGWRGYWQEQNFIPEPGVLWRHSICGWKRPQSYYRDALWKNDQLSIC